MTRDTTASTDGETSEGARDDDQGQLSRRGVLRGSAALGAAPIIASAAGAAEAGIGDGPQGIHVACGQEPTSMMTVAFTGAPAATGATVRYGEPGDLDTTTSATGRPVPGRDAMAYTATLTGLAPDTAYAYEVELNGTSSERRRFRTAPSYDGDTGTDGFTITQVGDHGAADPDNPGQRPGDAHPRMVMAIAEALDPDMQLLSGDISYSNGKPSTWELYFDVHEDYYGGTADRPATPFMTVPGNHEAEVGTGMVQYDRRLNDAMPIYDPDIDVVSKQRWWDIVYENAFIMGLNTTADACGDLARAEEFVPLYDPRCETEQGLTYGAVQERYMRSALQRAEDDEDVKWKIVTFHGPLWTTSPDHEPRRDLQERWGPIFDEYDVDLVLHGDNHVYERTKPIRHTDDLLTYSERRAPARTPAGESAPPPAEAAEGLELPFDEEDPHGTTFIVNGTGGVSHYPLGVKEKYMDTTTGEFFGITRLDIDEGSIDVQYVAAPPLAAQDLDESTPLTDDFDPTGDAVRVVDEFSIVKDSRGRPTQVEGTPSGPTTPQRLAVAGRRTDDGSLFTAGSTNQMTVEVTEANDAVELRDRIPAAWTVVGGEVERVEPGPEGTGTKYVYLDPSAPDDEGGRLRADYFVEAPSDADGTGKYTFGPVQARGTEQYRDAGWTAVAGTTSTERVVGIGTQGLL
ncbi:purple acid phosphatase family protein [Haloglomus salinum]|uniref:purple acid phosphatase family protein n=1 Tax=Haloglomus salinum TaxID=2962673 RepID=UPI0020C9975E|nr:metallophosphoesterase family protein [Haloglomus salinum]